MLTRLLCPSFLVLPVLHFPWSEKGNGRWKQQESTVEAEQV